MSTFRNISPGQTYVTGFLRTAHGAIGSGAQYFLEQGEEFEGSNYFKRYTYDGMIAAGVDAATAAEEAILEVVVDDGIPFDDAAADILNYVKVFNEIITVGNNVLIDFQDELGGPSYLTMIEISGEDVYVYLNDSSDARLTVVAGSTVSFSNGELLLSSIRIANTISGAMSSATAQVTAATVQ